MKECMNGRWTDAFWRGSSEVCEPGGLHFKLPGVLAPLQNAGSALVSPPPGWMGSGVDRRKQREKRKSGGLPRRQSSAGQCGWSWCRQPLRAERGAEVRGSFSPLVL